MTQKQVFSVWIDREEMNWKRWVSSVTVCLSGSIKLQTPWFCRERVFLVLWCLSNGKDTADFNGSKTLPLGSISHSSYPLRVVQLQGIHVLKISFNFSVVPFHLITYHSVLMSSGVLILDDISFKYGETLRSFNMWLHILPWWYI